VNKIDVHGLEAPSRFVFCNLSLMHCRIRGDHLLGDGRFAFSMQCYWGDVRKYIDLGNDIRVKQNVYLKRL
jgi:hypothetical protein